MVASDRPLRRRRRGFAVDADAVAVARWRDSLAIVNGFFSAGVLDPARFLADTGAFIESLLARTWRAFSAEILQDFAGDVQQGPPWDASNKNIFRILVQFSANLRYVGRDRKVDHQ